jgi:hypothetical protein
MGSLLFSENHDKSRIRETQPSERSLFHTTTRKLVVFVMMGWQESTKYKEEYAGSLVGCFATWVIN